MSDKFECYYFIKAPAAGDMNNEHPFACICLQGSKENNEWKFNRGVSICSSKDSFKKKVGRMKAKATLANGEPKTAAIRNENLSKSLNQIYWMGSHLELRLPNNNPKYGLHNNIVNNEYKKAEFGISHDNLTSKEKEIVKGFLEEV